MNKCIVIKEECCIGCGLCTVYCRAEHSVSKDVIKAFKREVPRPVSRARIEKDGQTCFSIQCRHCDEPWCVYSCITGAMHRESPGGPVTVDADRCVGCWTCILACPFGAIAKDDASKVAAKCDLCPDREVPACVANCPNEALVLSEAGAPR